MIKKLLFCLLAVTVITAKSQITNSLALDPTSITNVDGTHSPPGQGQFYYPNGGEVRFAEDHGDAVEVVKFYTMNTYPQRFLLYNNNISLNFGKHDPSASPPDSLQRVDFEWVGSSAGAFLARADTQNTAVLHYYTQWFSSSGRTNVQGGGAIVCQSIYPNIDLVYTSNNAGLVMYFIVYPGGNYNDIVMHLNGSKANSIVGNKLRIDANWESMTLEKPQMYQYTISGSVVTPVNVCNASWSSSGSDTYQISNSTSYSSSLPLIIQLKQGNASQVTTTGLNWSTYFGGSAFDFLTKTHCDASDNLYVAGYTNSSNFPQNPGATGNLYKNVDGVIAKFSPTGALLWSTYVGGSSNDEIHDFDFRGGSIYCVGKTASSDLVPVTKGGATNNSTIGGPGWDGFIFEFAFNALGVISNNWLTYFGGNGDEELNACKFDASGNFFVAGASASTNMTPMGPSGSYQVNFNSAQLSSLTPLSTDAIIVMFDPGSLQAWFTFVGTDALGTNANTYAADYFYDLTIDGNEVYACGKAGGTNLPSKVNSKFIAGDFDGILANFSTAGVLNASKYTEGNYANYAVKVLWTDVYTVGEARSSSMNPVNSSQYYYNGTFAGGAKDGCFSVHDQYLSSTTIHNSFLGGSGDDAAYDIQFTTNGLFLISGGTNSSNFPISSLAGMYPGSTPGLYDNFIAAFQKGNTSLTWSCYLGDPGYNEGSLYPEGIDFQQEKDVATMALNSQNYIYVLGETTGYTNFPLSTWLTNSYYQPQKNAYLANDATITRLDATSLNSVVGLKDFENSEFVFGIYPNPTANNISITNTALVNGDLRYAFYDLSGKKLKAGSLKASDAKKIDVSFLPQGVYIINVGNGAKTYSNKFIKTEN